MLGAITIGRLYVACKRPTDHESVKKPLPHLQFAVLAILSTAPLAGQELRVRLSDLGVAKSGPAFYRLMARLEEAGLVAGWYEQEVIAGQALRERRYRVTSSGLRARDATARFHQDVIATYSGQAEAHA